MDLDLSDKQWPKHISENPQIADNISNVGSFICESVHDQYVREGTMVAMPMSMAGVSEPIARGESAITAMALDSNYAVYGGTTGSRSHLFCAMLHGATGFVHDLGIAEGAKSCTAINVHNDIVYACVNDEHTGWIVSVETLQLPFDCLQEWGVGRKKIEKLTEPAPGRKIVHAISSSESASFFALLDDGMLVKVSLPDGKTKKLVNIDPTGRFSRRIAMDTNGIIYGTGLNGQIWQYDSGNDNYEKWDAFIPCGGGRRNYNKAANWAYDEANNILYGSSEADGTLFAINIAEKKVRSLGLIESFCPAYAMSVTCDGRVFGVAGREKDAGRFFVYDPHEAELKDLGVCISCLGERTYGFRFQTALKWRDGAILLGEADQSSHLWIYFPSVQALPKV